MAKEAQSLLEIDLDKLCNSLKHLERSNQELKQALQEGPDPDLQIAFNENIVVIAKQRAHIAALRDEIMKLRGHTPHSTAAGAVAVPLSDNDSQQPDQDALAGSSQTQGASSSMEVEHAQPALHAPCSHGQGQQGEGAAGLSATAPPPAATPSQPTEASGSGGGGDSMEVEEAAGGAAGSGGQQGMWL